MRPIGELIHQEKATWRQVNDWARAASNSVRILPILSKEAAKKALYHAQVSTKSTMGSVIYKSGGILIGGGWIRILGSGSKYLKRSLPEWNKGKTFSEYGERPPYLLIGDDVLGGLFALNNGAWGGIIGQIYYFDPLTLSWENLEMSYTDFLMWAFMGDLDIFYDGIEWLGWEKDLKATSGDKGIHFQPPLFMEAESHDVRTKKVVPMEMLYRTHMEKMKEKD